MRPFNSTAHPSRSFTLTKGRRARITCDYCQRRKVRCDAEISLLPCTNCRLDGVECMLFKGKRETRGRANIALQIIEHTLHANPGPSPLSRSLRAQIRGFSMMPATYPGRGPRYRPARSASTEPQGRDNYEEHREQEDTAPQTIETEIKPSCGWWSLPPFIRSPPKHLDDSDYKYLLRKHAFVVPSEALQRVLVKSYLESVHAVLPVIDMHEFLLSMLRKSSRISLFLYQAVMYAGIGTVPFEILADEGFNSRVEARDKFYSKVEALDRVGYETDLIDRIQGELLMAYWQGVLRPRFHRSCWIQLVWSNFQSLEPSLRIPDWDGVSAASPKRKSSTYRRTYWGCFLVDHLFALATRRRPYFSRSLAPEIEVLKPSDFHITPYSKDAFDALEMRPMGFSVNQQVQLVKMFILNVSLFELIEQVISDSYRHIAISARGLSPEQLASEVAEARRCASRLLDWYDIFTKLVNSCESSKPIDLSQSFLSIIFDASLSLLLYREFVHGASALDTRMELGDLQRKRFLATAGVTSAFVCLRSNGLLEYVPPCLTALLLSAGVTHWIQMRESSNPYLRGKNSGCFSQCLVILGALGNLYPGVQQWVNRLQDAVARDRSSPPSTKDDILSLLYPVYPYEGTSLYTNLLSDADDARGKDYDDGVAVPDNFAWFTTYESSVASSFNDNIGPSAELYDSTNRDSEYDTPSEVEWELGGPNQKQMHSSSPEEMAAFMVNMTQFIDSPSGTTEQCIAPSSIFSEVCM